MKGLNLDILKGSYLVGTIVDNNDPDKEGRARVRVFGLYDDIPDDKLPWFHPVGKTMFAGGADGFANISIPKINTIVQVHFSEGNLYSGEYSSIQNFSEDVKNEISDTYLNSHVLAYDADEQLKLLYTPGKGLIIYLKSSEINIAADSSITILHKDSKSLISLVGDTITIASDNTVNITSENCNVDSPNITLGKGATESLILGDTFKELFDLHTHPGPNTPPTLPLPTGVLSKNTKTK